MVALIHRKLVMGVFVLLIRVLVYFTHLDFIAHAGGRLRVLDVVECSPVVHTLALGIVLASA